MQPNEVHVLEELPSSETMMLYFSASYYSLIDRGFVVAIAQIRGGSDLGEQWYEDGKLLKKKNTFTDFVACSQLLIDEKYTSASKLVVMGGSAGELLIDVYDMNLNAARQILAKTGRVFSF